jgi:hypothetical protein
MAVKLPVYKLVVRADAETGAEYTALVDEPAIEKYFLAFAKEKPAPQFFASDDQQIISGPLMIPDLPMYRSPNPTIPHEHYVVFDKEAVKEINHKYCKEGNFNNVNLMHEPGTDPGEVYMIESFISDSARGISAPEQFKDLPEGTWFVSYKIDNADIWERIKKAEFRGLSIEGVFAYVESDDAEIELLSQIEEIIEGPSEEEALLSEINEILEAEDE